MQMFLLNAHWRALWKRAQRLLAPRLLPDGPTLKRRHTSSSWTVSQAGRGSDGEGGVADFFAGRLCWASRGAGRRCEAAQVVRKCEVSCRLGRLHPVAGAASCWHRVVGGEAVFFFFLVAPRRDHDLLLLFFPFFFLIRAWSPTPPQPDVIGFEPLVLYLLFELTALVSAHKRWCQKTQCHPTANILTSIGSLYSDDLIKATQVQKHRLAASTVKSIGLHALWIIRVWPYSRYDRTRVTSFYTQHILLSGFYKTHRQTAALHTRRCTVMLFYTCCV